MAISTNNSIFLNLNTAVIMHYGRGGDGNYQVLSSIPSTGTGITDVEICANEEFLACSTSTHL